MSEQQIIVDEFIKACNKCEKNITDAWEKLSICDFKNGMNEVTNMFDQLNHIINIVNILNKEEGIFVDISILMDRLRGLEDAMRISDYIAISDIIKYEIGSIMEEWKSYIVMKYSIYLN